MWHVLVAILFIIIFNIFLWLYLQRKTRRESSDHVNMRVSAAIHQYFALAPGDDSD